MLKIKAAHMEDAARNCVLIVGKMTVEKYLHFHPRKRIIEGFKDLKFFRRNIAMDTQVLVFMLRELFTNWKQPLALFVSKSGIILSAVLKEIVDTLYETSLKVRALVSDQGASYNSMTIERVSIQSPCFIQNKEKIYYIFDYLHLRKSVRNNLLNHGFLINNFVVSWRDVISLWNLEKDKSVQAAYKLSEKHVRPNCFDKMKPKLALQVFSKIVSTAMYITSLDHSTYSQFFETLNDLFDNLNSRFASDSNPTRYSINNSRFNNIEEILISL